MNIYEEVYTVPNLEECKKLLCIQPHPDDTDVGAGATIAKLIEEGCKVYYLTVLDGRFGIDDTNVTPEELVEIRIEEQKKAAQVLGVEKTIFLGYRDIFTGNLIEIRDKLVEIIRDIKPEMVMTVDPWLPYEAHPDHRNIGMIAVEASLFAKMPYYPYEKNHYFLPPWELKAIVFYHTSNPNTFIEISEDHMKKKIEAIAAHESQFPEKVLKLYSAFFYEQAKHLGKSKELGMVEAFKVLSLRHLHCFPDAIKI
ncbi:MAG: PIG-L deacetylase family protein [Caldanaerobacter sp.]